MVNKPAKSQCSELLHSFCGVRQKRQKRSAFDIEDGREKARMTCGKRGRVFLGFCKSKVGVPAGGAK